MKNLLLFTLCIVTAQNIAAMEKPETDKIPFAKRVIPQEADEHKTTCTELELVAAFGLSRATSNTTISPDNTQSRAQSCPEACNYPKRESQLQNTKSTSPHHPFRAHSPMPFPSLARTSRSPQNAR